MITEANEKLDLLLHGGIPEPIDTGAAVDEDERELLGLLNSLFSSIGEIHEFINPLSKGLLRDIKAPSPKNFLASPFKELHSHLCHLAWQAKQVADGDYSQRVDFMGDFSEAFNAMIVSLDNNERALKARIAQLEDARSRIKKLEGILPICANCKRIRLEGSGPSGQDSWVEIESYISGRTEAQFSHGVCPECMGELYPDVPS